MNTQEKLDLYVNSLISELERHIAAPIKDAIFQIKGSHRRLLALRGYLRYPSLDRGSIDDNWAWDKEKEEEFISSGLREEFCAEVAKVKRAFEASMTGYQLQGGVKVRTLSRQIDLWNGNETVNKFGLTLHRKCLEEVEHGGYGDVPETSDLARFRDFLAGKGLVGSPSNATPGLSDHGQARAIDFSVYRGKLEVAGQSTKTAKEKWDKPGFTEALRAAARGSKLSGPLKAPYEPWHYSFIP